MALRMKALLLGSLSSRSASSGSTLNATTLVLCLSTLSDMAPLRRELPLVRSFYGGVCRPTTLRPGPGWAGHIPSLMPPSPPVQSAQSHCRLPKPRQSTPKDDHGILASPPPPAPADLPGPPRGP